MFTLNLIKSREISYRRRQALIGFIGGCALVLCLTVVLMGSWCVGKWSTVRAKRSQISALEVQIAIARKKAGARVKEPSLAELVAPLKNARRAVKSRVLWSQKLDGLAEGVPDRLWVCEVRVEKEKVKPEDMPQKSTESEAEGEAVGPPKDIILRTLIVQGYARAGHTAAAELVSGLAERLAQNDRFMAGLSKVESISINPSPNGDDEGLLLFELRCPFLREEGDG